MDPTSVIADGMDESTATVTVEDAFGNGVGDETVAFTTDGDVAFSDGGSCVTDGSGTCAVTITASTTPGQEAITADANGVTDSATLTEQPQSLAAVSLSLEPTSITANGSDTATAVGRAEDDEGNPVGDATISFSTNGDVAFSAPSCTTASAGPDAGTCAVTITASTTAGDETITAAIDALSDSATLTEVAGPVATLGLALDPTSVVANGTATSTATATAEDAHGNPVGGASVAFMTSGDVTFSSSGSCTTSGSGTCAVTITSSTTAGEETVTAAVGDVSGTATLTEVAGPVHRLGLTLSPASLTANGSDTSIATATLFDVNDNAVGGATVTFTTDGDVTFPGGTTCATAPSGSCQLTIRASTTPGDNKVVASAGGKSASATLNEAAPAADAAEQGYAIVGGDGGIFTFGEAEFFGSMGGQTLNSPVISMAYTPTGKGYWLVAGDGGIFSFGDAAFHGSMGGQPLNSPVIGMEATPSGEGYWLFAADGGIFSFGDADFHGSMGAAPLNAPVVGMAASSTGAGYWLVAQDGGIFSFGDATFHGSTGGMSLVEPVFDMDATADDGGYWLVARDGGIFAFGNATFHGSAAGQGATTVIGMGATPAALGYWIADDRGGVFIFGAARFFGDLRNVTLNAPAVGFAALPG